MEVQFDLVQVILKLSKCRTMDAVIEVIRDRTRALTGADGITVVLRDEDRCFYVEENAVGTLWKGKRFPMSACISGWCMLNRQQVVITDIYQDERIPHDAYRPTFVQSLAMTPIRSADPIGVIGAYWATEHQATTQELAILQALGDSAAMALENAQLIDALRETSRRKDKFLSMLAHELRNPLAPIRNGLHLLRLHGEHSEIISQASEMMNRQVVHLSHIVDDLLDVARITNGKIALRKSTIDLAALLRQCVSDRRQEIDVAGLTLKLEVPLNPVRLQADTTRLTQVFSNVLDNARKYTPSGGMISVSLHADPTTRIAKIVVQDTGIGISAQHLTRVFDTFMQADNSLDRTVGGLGLGLAIAQGLLGLHEGTIVIQSPGCGAGTQVTITLPDVEVSDPIPTQPPPTATVGSKKRVLIIEDNRDSALSLQKLMNFCGYDTLVAYDGCAGVELAIAERPDIILCDVGLPKMDGYAVASVFRQNSDTESTRMIAVTGYGSDDDRLRTRSAGFDAHLVKPIDLDELLRQMEADQPVAAGV